uniref:Protein shisa-9-like n=1 Tax=Saccoglossus kowalevskii TaxID=10224 RepID=A0ABM0GJM7_SACKO|nr:PREDICTED: protein shisa-9-like [Saccoglossus kowalevskii]
MSIVCILLFFAVTVHAYYCPGFLDNAGVWRSGFFCPLEYNSPNYMYCCGQTYTRYCCDYDDHQREQDTSNKATQGIYGNGLTGNNIADNITSTHMFNGFHGSTEEEEGVVDVGVIIGIICGVFGFIVVITITIAGVLIYTGICCSSSSSDTSAIIQHEASPASGCTANITMEQLQGSPYRQLHVSTLSSPMCEQQQEKHISPSPQQQQHQQHTSPIPPTAPLPSPPPLQQQQQQQHERQQQEEQLQTDFFHAQLPPPYTTRPMRIV